jgi:hypothetical protein
MAATVSKAAQALKRALQRIPDLRVYEFIPDTINVPMALVALEEATYHRAFGGGDVNYRFVVTVVVGRTSERVAQQQLDEFLSYSGAKSVRQAIETDPDWDCDVQTLMVERAGNLQPLTVNESSYLSVDFTVQVHA